MTQSIDFDTPCETHSLELQAGLYRFEVWGAQGGTWWAAGGKGGYASGEIAFFTKTRVFVNVGGNGNNTEGGCNGGGKNGTYRNSGGGGTDIRISENSLYSRVIVAGGGGGSGDVNTEYGGAGGGSEGQNGIYPNPIWPGKGGSQNSAGTTCADGTTSECSPGSFGYGGNATYSYAGSGGGGWFGGSASRGSDPGGGGSGYVFIQGSYVPTGFLLDQKYYLRNTQLIQGTQNVPCFNSPGSTEIGRSGDGAARITLLKSCQALTCKKQNFGKSLHLNLYSTLVLFIVGK